jgi:hypothetical protein
MSVIRIEAEASAFGPITAVENFIITQATAATVRIKINIPVWSRGSRPAILPNAAGHVLFGQARFPILPVSKHSIDTLKVLRIFYPFLFLIFICYFIILPTCLARKS